MNISIRLETPADYRETEVLTREAFRDIFKPGCDEHLPVHTMRRVPAFIPALACRCIARRAAGDCGKTSLTDRPMYAQYR